MKSARFSTLVAVLLSALALSSAVAQEGQRPERIRRAIDSGEFDAAAALCLEGLRAKPGDPELRFLLARSQAFAGRWDEAEETLGLLLEEYPENTDFVLFEARIQGWKKNYGLAEAGFLKVLETNPGNGEALVGLADLHAWRGDWDSALGVCRRALAADSGNAAVLFRMGTIHLRRGEIGEARAFFRKAVESEPSNEEYARAANEASLSSPGRTEFWLAARTEGFNDGRTGYSDLEAAFKLGVFDDRAQVILKAARAWRFGGHDDRFGIEAYPRLWKGAYGYVDLIFSPGGGFSPHSSLHGELFQSALPWLEVSLGARRMAFEGGAVTMLAGSVGAYWGRLYPSVRTFVTFGAGATEFTWIASLRRYFGGTGYAWAGLGHGARSLEGVSIDDVLGERSWLTELGADVTVLKHVRLRAVLTLRRESTGLSSTALAAVAGYRW